MASWGHCHRYERGGPLKESTGSNDGLEDEG